MKMKYEKAILVAILLATTSITHAEGLKDMVQDTLRNGTSEAVLDSSMAEKLMTKTNSNEPIYVKAKKVASFSNGCGRIRFELKQAGVKDVDGKNVQIDPWLEMNICPDGNPPVEAIREMKVQKEAFQKSCRATIRKDGMDKATSGEKATLIAEGCTKNGVANWRYEGDCEVLKMPAGVATINRVDESGTLQIPMLLPKECKANNNKWFGQFITEKGMNMGMIAVTWK